MRSARSSPACGGEPSSPQGRQSGNGSLQPRIALALHGKHSASSANVRAQACLQAKGDGSAQHVGCKRARGVPLPTPLDLVVPTAQPPAQDAAAGCRQGWDAGWGGGVGGVNGMCQSCEQPRSEPDHCDRKCLTKWQAIQQACPLFKLLLAPPLTRAGPAGSSSRPGAATGAHFPTPRPPPAAQ